MFVRNCSSRTRWTIGFDNEVDRKAVGGPRLGRPDDGHQRSSGSNQACGPSPDVAADDVEHQIDTADILQGVLEIDELLRAEERRIGPRYRSSLPRQRSHVGITAQSGRQG